MDKRWLWVCPAVIGAVVASSWAGPARAARPKIFANFSGIYIEYNATANDLGFHISMDGEDWKSLRIFNPLGREVFRVAGSGKGFGRFGMTELFFEGAEPALTEVPREQLLALFPQGGYRFVGRSVEGADQEGIATLSHDVPDGPVIVAPPLNTVVNPSNLVIRWNPVTTPAGIQIAGYQVIVEKPDKSRTYTVNLGPAATSLSVPAEFLDPATSYLAEVLAIEKGGNQTLSEWAFSTQ